MSKPSKPRSRRRPLTNDERAEIAVSRLSGDSIEALQKRFGRAPAVLSRAVKAALKDRLVEIRKSSQSANYKRAKDLEDQLKERFPGLRSVIVIEVDENAVMSDEDLHRLLGRAMARWLVEAQPFRDGDIIGLGSGRGVCFTVDALSAMKQEFGQKEIKIVSLMGCLQGFTGGKWDWALDADRNAYNLFRCFDAAITKFKPVLFPLLHSTPEEAQRFRVEAELTGERWVPPVVAIVGAGMFTADCVYRRIFDGGHLKPEIVQKLIELCTQLIDRCGQTGMAEYSPVAIVCNHFAFLPPPAEVQGPDVSAIEEEIRKLVKELNDRLVAINDEQLASIKALVLVAGGREKAPAIFNLLTAKGEGNAEKFAVRWLCTDSLLAKRILAQVSSHA